MYISLSLYGQAYLKKLDKAKAAALAAKNKHKQAQGSSTTQGKRATRHTETASTAMPVC
jgi:hypothetical protein